MSWLISIILAIIGFTIFCGFIYLIVWLEYEFSFPVIGLIILIFMIVIISLTIHTLLF